jgi:hypothetical protein
VFLKCEKLRAQPVRSFSIFIDPENADLPATGTAGWMTLHAYKMDIMRIISLAEQ